MARSGTTKLLLIGADGQLGKEIKECASSYPVEVVPAVYPQVDITDSDGLFALLRSVQPEVVINCAAYTNVDGAEEDQVAAFEVNAAGPANLARAAREISARVVHVSTDYVFNGKKNKPQTEKDPVDPCGVYGRSKLEGEKNLLELYPESSLVVRTAWLHGAHGHNFLHTMLKLFKERTEIKVVDDQVGSPTWTGWLARVLLELSHRSDHCGVLHAACGGAVSWYEYAATILDMVRGSGSDLKVASLLPQSTEEAARKAPRPAYSVLDCSLLSKVVAEPVMNWREGVYRHLLQLGIHPKPEM